MTCLSSNGFNMHKKNTWMRSCTSKNWNKFWGARSNWKYFVYENKFINVNKCSTIQFGGFSLPLWLSFWSCWLSFWQDHRFNLWTTWRIIRRRLLGAIRIKSCFKRLPREPRPLSSDLVPSVPQFVFGIQVHKMSLWRMTFWMRVPIQFKSEPVISAFCLPIVPRCASIKMVHRVARAQRDLGAAPNRKNFKNTRSRTLVLKLNWRTL